MIQLFRSGCPLVSQSRKCANEQVLVLLSCNGGAVSTFSHHMCNQFCFGCLGCSVWLLSMFLTCRPYRRLRHTQTLSCCPLVPWQMPSKMSSGYVHSTFLAAVVYRLLYIDLTLSLMKLWYNSGWGPRCVGGGGQSWNGVSAALRFSHPVLGSTVFG